MTVQRIVARAAVRAAVVVLTATSGAVVRRGPPYLHGRGTGGSLLHPTDQSPSKRVIAPTVLDSRTGGRRHENEARIVGT